MYTKEYDGSTVGGGSVTTDGCESFKFPEKSENTNSAPQMYPPLRLGVEWMSPTGRSSGEIGGGCEGCNNCEECNERADVVLINKDALWGSFSGGTPGGGTKRDTGKTRLDLIPTEAIEEIGRAFTHGAKEYGDYNYRRGIDCSRLYGAALRHLNAYWGGEDIDKDSGLPHLALAGSEICMLMVTGPEHDDRYYEDGE